MVSCHYVQLVNSHLELLMIDSTGIMSYPLNSLIIITVLYWHCLTRYPTHSYVFNLVFLGDESQILILHQRSTKYNSNPGTQHPHLPTYSPQKILKKMGVGMEIWSEREPDPQIDPETLPIPNNQKKSRDRPCHLSQIQSIVTMSPIHRIMNGILQGGSRWVGRWSQGQSASFHSIFRDFS